MNNYLKKISEIIKEDSNDKLIRKICKKAENALNLGIANYENELSKQQDVLDAIEEKLKACKYPSELIEDAQKYIDSIIDAEEERIKQEKKIEKFKQALKLLKDFKEADFKEEEEK
jgi:uncharacterized protein related to proFAR isomerase